MSRRVPTIAFLAPPCLVDFTNGAATATRDGLKLLAAQGFQCMAFCGTRLDEAGEGLIQEQLFRRKFGLRSGRPNSTMAAHAGPAANRPHPGPLPEAAHPHPDPLPEGEGPYVAG